MFYCSLWTVATRCTDSQTDWKVLIVITCYTTLRSTTIILITIRTTCCFVDTAYAHTMNLYTYQAKQELGPYVLIHNHYTHNHEQLGGHTRTFISCYTCSIVFYCSLWTVATRCTDSQTDWKVLIVITCYTTLRSTTIILITIRTTCCFVDTAYAHTMNLYTYQAKQELGPYVLWEDIHQLLYMFHCVLLFPLDSSNQVHRQPDRLEGPHSYHMLYDIEIHNHYTHNHQNSLQDIQMKFNH